MTRIVRETRETTVEVDLVLEGGPVAIDTPHPFLTHMLQTLARYAGFGLELTARGDLQHHVIEDTAIALGAAYVESAVGPRARYGHRVIPMDDALVECALDAGGRPYYEGPVPSSLYEHWMRSFADHARATLHLRVLRGVDRHHVVEAAFKALGGALSQASQPAERIQSTKGEVRVNR